MSTDTYTVPAKVGATFRHMQRTYTYAYSCGTVHYWRSESVNGASYIRQTHER